VRTKLQLVQLKNLTSTLFVRFPLYDCPFAHILDVNEKNSRGEAGRIGLDDVDRFGVVFVCFFLFHLI